MKEKVNQVRIVDVFEKCWRELLKGYGENRLFNVYCSEADIQLHLASKLLKELHPPVCVYARAFESFNKYIDNVKPILDKLLQNWMIVEIVDLHSDKKKRFHFRP